MTNGSTFTPINGPAALTIDPPATTQTLITLTTSAKEKWDRVHVMRDLGATLKLTTDPTKVNKFALKFDINIREIHKAYCFNGTRPHSENEQAAGDEDQTK